ncbi:hypothetical protein [Acetomicrobium sp.]|uniref:hypothetical protein n=1 Tax=Acetomicrobium sp. TaxID=1872099 RepID=UPI0028714A18|nr:hypothetical protein [Acetomicrobium sp.]MDR9769848.1 hypothetical protein [Acetomicrobium sp.]
MKIIKLFMIFSVLFLFIAVPIANAGPSEPDVYYGMLSKLQLDPPYLFLSTVEGLKKFIWVVDETLFIGADDQEMTPRQFAQAYQGESVEVTAEGSKVKFVKRVFF